MKTKYFLIFIISISFPGCSVLIEKEDKKESHTEQKPQSPIIPPKTPAQEEITFDYFSNIREFAGSDKAAFFAFKPSSGKPEIGGIIGPDFLKGHLTTVGVITEETAGTIFQNSQRPPQNNEFNEILSSHLGYTFIYFENYEDNLCAGPDINRTIEVNIKISGRSLRTKFTFQASPKEFGPCEFHIDGFGTQNF